MGLERLLSAVPPVLFTANGTQYGVVTVTSTANFYVKSEICLQASSVNGGNPTKLEIKRVVSDTVMWVGPKGPITVRQDISAYTVAAGAFAFANEQPKAAIPMEERMLGSYIQEPINAWRTQPVDSSGNAIGPDNPLPVVFDGTISIGKVEVEGTNGHTIEPNADGSLNVVVKDSASVTIVNNYGEAVAVIPNGTDVILTYTALTGVTTFLQKISVSGENVARYDVLVNSAPVETQRSYWGNLNLSFDFKTDSASGGYPLNPGDVVEVTVLNYSPSLINANFEGRIQLVTIPI